MKMNPSAMQWHTRLASYSPRELLHSNNDPAQNESAGRANSVAQKAITWMMRPLGGGALPEDGYTTVTQYAHLFGQSGRGNYDPVLVAHPCKSSPSVMNVVKAAGAGGLAGLAMALPFAVFFGLFSGAVQTLLYGLPVGVFGGIATGVAWSRNGAVVCGAFAALCAVGVWVTRSQQSTNEREISHLCEEVSGWMALAPRALAIGVLATKLLVTQAAPSGAQA